MSPRACVGAAHPEGRVRACGGLIRPRPTRGEAVIWAQMSGGAWSGPGVRPAVREPSSIPTPPEARGLPWTGASPVCT